MALPNVYIFRRLSPFSAAQITRRNLAWYLPVSCLAETILSMILYVSSNIHELWRAACLSGFSMALRNLAKILSPRILVCRPVSLSGRRIHCLR